MRALMPSQVAQLGSVPRLIAETSEWTLKLLPAQLAARRTLDRLSQQHMLVRNYLIRPSADGESSEA